MINSILLQVNAVMDSTSVAQVPLERTISIIELLSDEGTLWVVVPLFLLSMVAIYITVERYLAIQKAEKVDPNFLNQIKDYIYDGKIDSAKNLCKNTNSPYARMIEKGVARIGKPLEDIRISVENVGKLEVFNLEKNLSTLATIAGASPMIGFLGTVLGMIVTFHEMKSSGQAVKIDELSGGIMQALVTTVAGLVIGIIAYLSYNLLVAKVNKVVNKMEVTIVEFMDILQKPSK